MIWLPLPVFFDERVGEDEELAHNRVKGDVGLQSLHQSQWQGAAQHLFPSWICSQRPEICLAFPTRAIEQFQDDRNKALRLFSG